MCVLFFCAQQQNIPGRYTNGHRGAITCSVCDAMYIGSSDCSVPIMGLIIIFTSLIVIFIVTFFVRRKFEHDKKVKRKLRTELIRHRQIVKVKTTDIELLGRAWKITEDQVKVKQKVGTGVHGNVYRGVLHNKYDVAVKILSSSSTTSAGTSSKRNSASLSLMKSEDSSNGDSRRSITSLDGSRSRVSSPGSVRQRNSSKTSVLDNQEIKFLMRTRHDRLVMFLGAGTMEAIAGSHDIFLITEWMDGGNLADFVWNKPTVEWKQRLQILNDVLEGLAYLHLLHKSVHCDLKSPNILLEKSSNGNNSLVRAKLADFGLSRIFTFGKRRVRGKGSEMSSVEAISAASWTAKAKGFLGTARWMAPELMDVHGALVSPSCDIFAFGVVMWETWCQKKPWCSFTSSSDIFDAVKKGVRPMIPTNLSKPDGYEKLMRLCWSQKASDRPLVDVVMNLFHTIKSNHAKDLIDAMKLKQEEVTYADNIHVPDHNPWSGIELTSSEIDDGDVSIVVVSPSDKEYQTSSAAK